MSYVNTKAIAQQFDTDTPVSKVLIALFSSLNTQFIFARNTLSLEEIFSDVGILPVLDYIVKARCEMLGLRLQTPECEPNSSGLMGYRLRLDLMKEEPLIYKFVMMQAAEDLFFEGGRMNDTIIDLDPIYQFFTTAEDKRDYAQWKCRSL